MANNNFFDNLFSEYLSTTAAQPTVPLSELLGPVEYAPIPGLDTSVLSRILGLEPPPVPTPALGLRRFSELVRARMEQQPTPRAVGIWFGDMYFSEPAPLSFAFLPDESGLYAVLVGDSNGRPRPFRVLYFGKAQNLAARVRSTHEKHDEWSGAAGGTGNLYVSYRVMPNSTDSQRASSEEALIRHYLPECNQTFNRCAALLGF